MEQPQPQQTATLAVLNPKAALWKMTLDEIRDAMLRCLLLGSEGHYRIGELYNHVVDGRRALRAGYRTTREYFRKHVRVLSHAALTRFGAVARHFTREVYAKYGMASLGALVEYCRLGTRYVPGDPGDFPIQLPRRGGMQLTKPFADCTLEDLGQAVAARRSAELSEEDQVQVKRYRETLRQYLEENTHLPVKLEVNAWPWEVRLHVHNVLPKDLEPLTEALQRSLKSAPPRAATPL